MSNCFTNNKILYWATAGCGCRQTFGFLESCFIDETCKVYVNSPYEDERWVPPGAPTHQMKIPKEASDYTIVCVTRNPYTRMISSWLNLIKDGVHTFDSLPLYIEERYQNKEDPDVFYYNHYPENRHPDYYVRLEYQYEDLCKIPQIAKIKESQTEEEWKVTYLRSYDDPYNPSNWTGKNENPFDKYNELRHQITNIYFNQELADIVYYTEKFIFDTVGYDRDSWK